MKTFMRCFDAQLEASGEISCNSGPLLQEANCLHRAGVDCIYLEKERPKVYFGSPKAKGHLIVCNRVAGGFGIFGDYDPNSTSYPVLLTLVHKGFDTGSALFDLAASFRKIATREADTTVLLLGDEKQEFCLKFVQRSSNRILSIAFSKKCQELDIAIVPQTERLEIVP